MPAGSRVIPIAAAMARAIVTTVYFGSCLIALLYVISSGARPGPLALSAGYLVVLLGLQVLYFGRPGIRLRSPLSYLMLAVQAAWVYLPILQFGYSWVGLPSLLAGAVLLVLPPAPALTL